MNCEIYITGSNSCFLTGPIATLLSGRYIAIPLYPLSYKELLSYYNDNMDVTCPDEVDIFREYLTYGGFPGRLNFSLEDAEFYLKDILNTIVNTDVMSIRQNYLIELNSLSLRIKTNF